MKWMHATELGRNWSLAVNILGGIAKIRLSLKTTKDVLLKTKEGLLKTEDNRK